MHHHASLFAIFTLSTIALANVSESSLGCYKSVGSMQSQGNYTFQTIGYCTTTCASAGQKYAALSKGSECLCGDTLPSASDKVDESVCNTPCTGYPLNNCGGRDSFSVWSVHSSGNPVPTTVVLSGTLTAPSIVRTAFSQSTMSGGIIVEGGNSPTTAPIPTISVNPGGPISSASVSSTLSLTTSAGSSTPSGSTTASTPGSVSSSSSSSTTPATTSNPAHRNTAIGGSIFLGAFALLFNL